MATQAVEIKIENPDVMAFITAGRIQAGDIIGSATYAKILDASPEDLLTLGKFALSIRALKQDSPGAFPNFDY